MPDTVDNLVLDLLEWLGDAHVPARRYSMRGAPRVRRLPGWEEANDRGFVERTYVPGRGPVVVVTDRGSHHLRSSRRRRLPAT